MRRSTRGAFMASLALPVATTAFTMSTLVRWLAAPDPELATLFWLAIPPLVLSWCILWGMTKVYLAELLA